MLQALQAPHISTQQLITRDTACFRPNLPSSHTPSVPTVCCEVPLPTAGFEAAVAWPSSAGEEVQKNRFSPFSPEVGPVHPDQGQTAQSLWHVTPLTPTFTLPGDPAEACGDQQSSPPRKQVSHGSCRRGTSGVWR